MIGLSAGKLTAPKATQLKINTNVKGSPILHPNPVKASNGVMYQSNEKHTPGQRGFRRDAGIEPGNSLELFEKSFLASDGKRRFSVDENGKVHRFSRTSDNLYHWSGSDADNIPLKLNEIRLSPEDKRKLKEAGAVFFRTGK